MTKKNKSGKTSAASRSQRIAKRARADARLTRALTTASSTLSAPVSAFQARPKTSYRQQASNGDTSIVRAVDRIGLVAVTENTESGEVRYSLPLNPRFFGATRLAVEASLWDQFRIKRITFTYCTASSTSTSGSLCMAVDPDVKDNSGYPIADIVDLSAFSNIKNYVDFPGWIPQVSTTFTPDLKDFLYVERSEDDEYWSTHGVFAVVASLANWSTNHDLGAIYYDAEVEFKGRSYHAPPQDFIALEALNVANVSSADPFGLTADDDFEAQVNSNGAPQNNIDTPSFPGGGEIIFTGLQPGEGFTNDTFRPAAYLLLIRWTDGTTASAAPAGTVLAGASIASSNFFSTTTTVLRMLVRADSSGTLHVDVSSIGTWAAAPQDIYLTLTSWPLDVSNTF